MKVVRALRNMYKGCFARVKTAEGTSEWTAMPDNTVQGGVFSTLAGKSIQRKLCSLAFRYMKGIASGNSALGLLVYLLFADDLAIPSDCNSDAVNKLQRYWTFAKFHGLGPKDKTVLKTLVALLVVTK